MFSDESKEGRNAFAGRKERKGRREAGRQALPIASQSTKGFAVVVVVAVVVVAVVVVVVVDIKKINCEWCRMIYAFF